MHRSSSDQFPFGAQITFQQENCTQSPTKFNCLIYALMKGSRRPVVTRAQQVA